MNVKHRKNYNIISNMEKTTLVDLYNNNLKI